MADDADVALNDLSGVAVLGSLMAAITRSADLHSIYDAALEALEAGLGVRRASILLFDDDGVMRFTAWRGLSEGYRRAVEGHTPWTPDTRGATTIVVPDVTADPGLAPYRATIAAEGIAAMVFVPLCSAAGVIGKFMLYFDAPRRPSAPELTLADVIAAQVAFAVQRLRAEQAARDRETELRLVTDIAPVYIAHCDAAGRYKFVNRPFAARFGLDPAAVIGRTIPEVLGQAAFESFREHVDAVLGGRFAEFEVEVPYREGTRIMRGEFAPELDADGRVGGFIAVVADVTERHRALAALRTSEAQLAQLADSVPQMVWMAGADGHADYYNERWYEFTGLPRGEGGDASWIPVLHPDDVERALACWRRSVETGEPYTIEYRFLDRRTGGYRWHLGRALPMRDDDGRIIRWFGTCTDIDDQKRSEQHSRFLAEASRTLSTLTDYPTVLQALAELAVPDFADWCAIDVVEPNGGLRRLALSYWDRTKVESAREMERRYPSRPGDPYGPRPAVRTGRSELVPEITDAMLVACAWDDEHLALLRAAGLSSVICVPVRAGAEVVGAITFLASDSKRRYGAVDLAVAEELAYRAGIAIENARLYADIQHADRQKDEFLAVLAHELRNPLAPIRTALQLVRLEPEDGSRRERAYDVMERQLRQMVRLVDDLLDVSRITGGRWSCSARRRSWRR